MAKDKMQDLRHHLFAQLEKLSDDELMKDPLNRNMEISRSKSICDISQKILNSATVEIQYLKTLSNAPANTQRPTFLGIDNK